MGLSRTIKASTQPRILVIYKKSVFQIYVEERKNPLMKKLLRAGDPLLKRLERAHHEHVKSLDKARTYFRKHQIDAVFRYRSDARAAVEYDLVVTLGGDGTLLWASHLIGKGKPVVAINTAPDESVGYFCAGTQHNLEDTLCDALKGALPEFSLQRMRINLDNKLLSNRVLNDILFCHSCPASMARYELRLGNHCENQKSSGLWIGPAAGSTAGQRSAGGEVLAIRSKKLQYVVREAYDSSGKGYQLTCGTFGENDALSIKSQFRDGRMFVDGPHKRVSIPIGGVLVCSHSDEPLTLLGFQHENRRKLA